jgi:hypothetical protein
MNGQNHFGGEFFAIALCGWGRGAVKRVTTIRTSQLALRVVSVAAENVMGLSRPPY